MKVESLQKDVKNVGLEIGGHYSVGSVYTGIKVTWVAEVAVLCDCGSCFEIRLGERTYTRIVAHEFFAYRAGAMPISIPTPTSLLRLIGEAAAKIVESNLNKPFSIDRKALRDLANKMKMARPKKPWQGKWKGGKSPCVL